MQDNGVMDICEPISETDALNQIPRPTTKEELAELERMNKTVSFGRPEKDGDMDAFFKAMEEEEQHWNEICQVKESVGEDIDENTAAELAYDIAAKMWPKKKKIPQSIVPESRKEQELKDNDDDTKEEEQQFKQRMMDDTPSVKFEPIVKERNKTEPKKMDDQSKNKVVEDPGVLRTIVEHPDGADMVEQEDNSSDEDVEIIDEADNKDESEEDSEDEDNMIIKPKNPTSFIPRTMIHTSIPEEVLKYQQEELKREDELRKQSKLPPVTSSTKFKTLPLNSTTTANDGSDEDEMFDDDNDNEDLVCFAHADGHASMPPKVQSSSSLHHH